MKKKIINIINICALAFFPQLTFAQWNPGMLSLFGLPSGSIASIIAGVMYWLLLILGVIGVIGFLISGLLYITAAGDEDQMKQGKRAMMYSIIGVIVGMLGLIVLTAAFRLLSGVEF